MEFIFEKLSDLRAVSVIIKRLPFWSDCKGLKMKTYTLTWKHAPYYGSTLSRCRFEPSAVAWPFMLTASSIPVSESPILAFMYICCRVDYPRSYRLSSCGRLVARSATYQGV